MEPPKPSSRSPEFPQNPQNFPLRPFLFFLVFTISLLLTPATSRIQVNPWMPSIPNPRIPYSDHCNHVVADSPLDPASTAASSGLILRFLRFDLGFFSGGDSLFGPRQPPTGLPNSVSFLPFSARRTLPDIGVYKVEASFTLRVSRSFPSSSSYSGGRRRVRTMRFRRPRIHAVGSRGGQVFGFSGFWSESNGRLCMVGSGSVFSATGNSRSFDAVLKLNYSTNSSIYGSLIRGVFESVNDEGEPNYFEPVSILGLGKNYLNYEYKLLEQGKRDCGVNEQESLSLDGQSRGFCSVLIQRTHLLRLGYKSGCGDNIRCSPLNVGIGYVPDFMSFFPMKCEEEGKMLGLLSFRNSSILGSSFPFDPSTTLVAEGTWNDKKNRFCGVACRISNFSDSLSNAVVGDCSVKVSLSFPAVLSIRMMDVVKGHVWSDRRENDTGYFSRIEFWSLKEPLWRLPGLKYEYTETNRIRKSCVDDKKGVNIKGKGYYPSAHSSDIEIYMSVRNSKGVAAADYAHASPLFVGDHLYRNPLVLGQGAEETGVALHMNNNDNTFTNITYRIRMPSDFDFGSASRHREISAEGIYDRETGILCMIGCQCLMQSNVYVGKNDSLDCDIVINIKFSPLNSRSGNRLKGTIKSTREKLDPLYFGRIDIWSNSISATQAKESVWRMDLEITIVLISNAFSCVFVGQQLYHVKQHPKALPFISIVMLITLTLGHMIPLLLNFEALFKTNHNQQNTFFENGGGLEVNEIIVRIVTMVDFLLGFRLLQLSWTARKSDENRMGIWDSDKKVLYVSLPLYVTGGLIAWSMNLKRTPYTNLLFMKPHSRHLLYRPLHLKHRHQRPSLWKYHKSYGGLMLDGFLLPQILFNAFYNSKEKALAVWFYMGTTVVRLLPHAYDLYRGHSYARLLDWSYIYANHKLDYYSTVWDIIIPCGCLLFAFLIFLQQRFGGQCIIPKRFRKSDGYERVATVGSVELHGEDVQKSSNSL